MARTKTDVQKSIRVLSGTEHQLTTSDKQLKASYAIKSKYMMQLATWADNSPLLPKAVLAYYDTPKALPRKFTITDVLESRDHMLFWRFAYGVKSVVQHGVAAFDDKLPAAFLDQILSYTVTPTEKGHHYKFDLASGIVVEVIFCAGVQAAFLLGDNLLEVLSKINEKMIIQQSRIYPARKPLQAMSCRKCGAHRVENMLKGLYAFLNMETGNKQE